MQKDLIWASDVSEDLRASVQTLNQAHHNNSINEILMQDRVVQKESQIEQNNKKYFEKKLNDRRKRTYEVLKQFDQELADIIIAPGEKLPNGTIGQNIEIRAIIKIQSHFRAYLSRRKYKIILHQKFLNMDYKQQRKNEIMMEQWAIERENQRLQQEIEEKNIVFKAKIKRKVDAATKIQRAFKRWYRFKKFGIDTWNANVEENDQMKIYQECVMQQFLAPETPEIVKKIKSPIISSKKVKKIPMGQINFNDSYNKTSKLDQTQFSVTHVFKTPRQEIESVQPIFNQSKTPRQISQEPQVIISPRQERKDLKNQMNDYLQQLPLQKNNLKQQQNERRAPADDFIDEVFSTKKEVKRYNNYLVQQESEMLQSIKDQLDGSLTNLFDSMGGPLIHENRFDLTQKIKDNFKDIFVKDEEFHNNAQTPNFSKKNYDENVYQNKPNNEGSYSVVGNHYNQNLVLAPQSESAPNSLLGNLKMGPIIYVQNNSNMPKNFKTPAVYHNNSQYSKEMFNDPQLVYGMRQNFRGIPATPKEQSVSPKTPKSPTKKPVFSQIYDEFLQEQSISNEQKSHMLIQDQKIFEGFSPRNSLVGGGSCLDPGPSVFEGDLFDDDQRYYESVSVDLEQEEFNKLQYYKNIINTLIEKAEESKFKKQPKQKKETKNEKAYVDGVFFPQTTSKKDKSNKKFIQNEFLKEYPTNIIQYEEDPIYNLETFGKINIT